MILVFFNIGISARVMRGWNIIKSVVFGTVNAFFLYIMVSAILFWIGFYSVKHALVLSGLVSSLLYFFLWKRHPHIIKGEVKKKDVFMVFFITIMVLCISWQKFDYFGMGQDEGVYQVKALELIYGNNQRVFTFDEINNTVTDEEYSEYKAMIASLRGYDRINYSYDFMQNIEDPDNVTGIFHGIPTWPSILALFGKTFGIENMQICQTLFFMLFLLLVYFILENVGIDTIIELVAIIILGVTPEILWISKSALTEMFLCVIVATYLLLLSEEEKHHRYYSCIPVVVFSFYHVTIFTIMPLFIVIAWVQFCRTGDKAFQYVSIIEVMGYLSGLAFMLYIVPVYTTNNYFRSLGTAVGMQTFHQLWFWILLVCAVVIVLTLLLPKLASRLRTKNGLYGVEGQIYKFLLVFVWIYAIYKYCKSGIAIEDIGLYNFAAISIATGIVSFPIILIGALAEKKERFAEERYVIFSVIYFYLLLWIVFLRPQVQYYYYYGRYNAPFLIIPVIYMCVLLKEKTTRWIILTGIVGILTYIEPDLNMINEQDDSLVKWSVLTDMLNTVDKENSAVIVGSDARQFALAYKAMGCDVYPEYSEETLLEESYALSKIYDRVYYVGLDIKCEVGDLLYNCKYQWSEDDLQNTQKYTKYSVQFWQNERTARVYECIAKETIQGDLLEGEGLWYDNGFVWTTRQSQVNIILPTKDAYAIEITQETPILKNNIVTYIYVNDNYIGRLKIEDVDQKITFDIPEEYVVEGYNTIVFKTSTWSPKDYNEDSEDGRKLGFSIQELKILKNE
jgi:hypothetical protein